MSNNTFGLFINLSQDCSHLLLSKEEKPWGRLVFSSKEHDKFFTLLEKLLREGFITREDLSYIAVAHGPGSYMGLRSGVAIGQGLSFALGIPLMSFPSFYGYGPKTSGTFCLLLPARQSGVYIIEGEKWIDGNLSYKENFSFLSVEALEKGLLPNHQLISPKKEFLEKKFAKKIDDSVFDEGQLSSYLYQKWTEKNFLEHRQVRLIYP